jgi:hypothetical protein
MKRPTTAAFERKSSVRAAAVSVGEVVAVGEGVAAATGCSGVGVGVGADASPSAISTTSVSCDGACSGVGVFPRSSWSCELDDAIVLSVSTLGASDAEPLALALAFPAAAFRSALSALALALMRRARDFSE